VSKQLMHSDNSFDLLLPWAKVVLIVWFLKMFFNRERSGVRVLL